MNRRIITIIIVLAAMCGGASAQQKQGHVMRPSSKGMGHPEEIGKAQVEVMYALNAEDISDERTYIDLHALRAGKDISKHYSRFLELNDSLYDDYNKRNPNASARPRVFYHLIPNYVVLHSFSCKPPRSELM